jgi:signal peptidase I
LESGLKRLFFIAGATLAGVFLVRTYLVEGIYIASASMEPAFPVGTHLFLNKRAYQFRSPKRGDVIVFPDPVDTDKDLVKRVIAVGGETVEIRKKQVTINGQPLEEPYALHLRGDTPLNGDNVGPIVVPEGGVFVLGDNRDFSGDSRDWKDFRTGQWIPFISIGSIKGRIISFTE